jgi:hypothetical protein
LACGYFENSVTEQDWLQKIKEEPSKRGGRAVAKRSRARAGLADAARHVDERR